VRRFQKPSYRANFRRDMMMQQSRLLGVSLLPLGLPVLNRRAGAMHMPYVRLRPEDLREGSAIWGWTLAPAELVAALGLGPERPIRLPLAGPRGEGAGRLRRQLREGLVTLLALDPSHPDRTLYLEIVDQCFPGFERWLENQVSRAFATERFEAVVREAVALVNLHPGCAEARFNLGLLLTRIASGDPDATDTRRWAALARGEFSRAAELAPELFWGYYHRGVLAFEARLPEAACEDWHRFLDGYFADKRVPRNFSLPLLPFEPSPEGGELPGLAYTVLLDYLGLALASSGSKPATAPAPVQNLS
jgi:hypothetical protein